MDTNYKRQRSSVCPVCAVQVESDERQATLMDCCEQVINENCYSELDKCPDYEA